MLILILVLIKYKPSYKYSIVLISNIDITIGRKDIGYLVGYPISSDPILSRNIGKSSFNIISLKRYRDKILVKYLVKRYIYEIILRNNIFIGYFNNG